jgi:hypothetical protein
VSTLDRVTEITKWRSPIANPLGVKIWGLRAVNYWADPGQGLRASWGPQRVAGNDPAVCLRPPSDIQGDRSQLTFGRKESTDLTESNQVYNVKRTVKGLSDVTLGYLVFTDLM